MFPQQRWIVALMVTWPICSIKACEHYDDPACRIKDPLEEKHFLNQWIVHIEGGEDVAKEVARDVGFDYHKPMPKNDDIYIFKHPFVPDRHKMRNKEVLKTLKKHDKIKTCDQHYAFDLTLSDLDDYTDMVGHSEPLEVKISYYDPEQMLEKQKREKKPVEFPKFKEPTAQEREETREARRKLLESMPELGEFYDFESAYAEKRRKKEEYLNAHPEIRAAYGGKL